MFVLIVEFFSFFLFFFFFFFKEINEDVIRFAYSLLFLPMVVMMNFCFLFDYLFTC